MISIILRKQQVLDADQKAIQPINFTWNLGQEGNITMFLIIEEGEETILNFFHKELREYCKVTEDE